MRGKTFDRELLVSKIAMMRIEGKSTHFILEFLKDDIKMGQTTAYEVLREAQDFIVKMTNQDLEKAYSEAIQQIERKMDSVSDKKTWLQFRAELNKLQGLYAAQKVEHSGQVGFTGVDIQIITNNGTQSTQTLPE
jgi:maltooligosyltrehalose synthase